MEALKLREVTYADIAALPEHLIGEIIDGELIVSPRPAPKHALAATKTSQDLAGYDRKAGGAAGPGGWWILFEPELHLGRHVLVPDLAGWRRERMPKMPQTAFFEVAPDWICEVVSPQSGRRDRIQKARIYAEFGVEWFWLVDPAQQVIEVWHREGQRWIVEGTWGGDDAEARVPPFDGVAIDLARWWETGEETP